MNLPENPITLTPEQIAELNKKLSKMRHDINNHLALMVAAAELVKFKPEMRERMVNTMADQAPKITTEVRDFSEAFEKLLGITHG
jgi:hypothetical protein